MNQRRARIVRGNALRRWVRTFRVRRALRGNIRNVNIQRRAARYIPRNPRAMVMSQFHPAVVAAMTRRYLAAQARLRAVRRPGLSVRRPRSVVTRASRRRLLRR